MRTGFSGRRWYFALLGERVKTTVLIVGAGPTGLALACHLRAIGMRVRIIDRKSGFSTTSKAIGLQYRVSEILACMGISDRFLAKGGNPTVVNIYVGRRRLVSLKFKPPGNESGRGAFEPKAIVIPQSETEELLGGLLRERGGRIEWNREFVEFEQDARGVACRVRSPDGSEEQVASKWLVSCEGTHSVIRELAGMKFVGKTYPLAFFLADVELEGWLRHGENYVWMHHHGSFAALPFRSPGRWRLFVDITNSPPNSGVTLDVIEKLMRQRTGGDEIRICNPTWISEFHIQCRMVDRYRNGRVFVAGDAAHAHSPTGGQGIVTGIQDATNLAWKLARVIEGAPQDLLDTYEEERLPKAAEVLKETDRTTRLLLAPDPFSRLLRDYLVLPIMRSSWIQKKLFAKLAQLHVNYRDCSLSQHQDAERSLLKAGDRAPDIAFQDSRSGKITTLFQLLAPMRMIALVGIGTPDKTRARIKETLAKAKIETHILAVAVNEIPRESDCLIDLHGDFVRLYGMRGQFLCLVRPDDHIGLFQRPVNHEALQDYLSLIA